MRTGLSLRDQNTARVHHDGSHDDDHKRGLFRRSSPHERPAVHHGLSFSSAT
jgi:hypothetical protein